jgi:hypothetical protein
MLFFDVEGVLYADRMERAANGNPVHHDAVAPGRDHDPKMGQEVSRTDADTGGWHASEILLAL